MTEPTTAPLNQTEAPFCVVQSSDSFYLSRGDGMFAPIVRRSLPRHRGTVFVSEINDLAAMGLPGGEYDILMSISVRRPEWRAIGHCLPEMKRRIVTALMREREARRLEDKYRVAPGFAQIAAESARMAPGTRRIGAAQHA